MIYPGPTGPSLSDPQVQALDDSFLSSDPYAHACARIGMLLNRADAGNGTEPPTSVEGLPETMRRFAQNLGFMPHQVWQSTSRERATQLAQDAFSLRHHLAETAVRLAWAALSPAGDEGGSLWARLAESPTTTTTLVSEFTDRHDAMGSDQFTSLILAPHQVQQIPPDEDVRGAIESLRQWLTYAAVLLRREDIPLNAVNNKIKHGLAIRARDDVRLDLHLMGIDPGGLTVSAANKPALNIVDGPVLEALYRAPGGKRSTSPLELSLVRIDLAAVLAEAQMIAMVHGAMFHVLAVAHFAASSNGTRRTAGRPPAHPGLPANGLRPPTDPRVVVGMRFPLTRSADANQDERMSGFASPVDFTSMRIAAGPIAGRIRPDTTSETREG